MSDQLNHPESVTLTDEEWGATHWRLFREHRPVGGYPPIGQMDGDCHGCTGSWPCLPVREALAERDAAREQALREEFEAKKEILIDMLRTSFHTIETITRPTTEGGDNE